MGRVEKGQSVGKYFGVAMDLLIFGPSLWKKGYGSPRSNPEEEILACYLLSKSVAAHMHMRLTFIEDVDCITLRQAT